MFELKFSKAADVQLLGLEQIASKDSVVRQIKKSLGYLQVDPKHPSLHTHVYYGMVNPFNQQAKVFEAYAQNKTPGAYRIFWCYGPKKDQLTVLAITPHP